MDNSQVFQRFIDKKYTYYFPRAVHKCFKYYCFKNIPLWECFNKTPDSVHQYCNALYTMLNVIYKI